MTSEYGKLNIPEQLVAETQRERLERLYFGIRARKDPVSWRTLNVDARTLAGTPHPEFGIPQSNSFERAGRLVSFLTEGTYLEPLKPEILSSMGYGEFLPSQESENRPLAALLLNGRHLPEPLLWSLADHLSSQGKEVAVVNPVGHYNDAQTRIVAPPLLTREVKKLIIVASTQEMYGGNLDVLAQVINTLVNPHFSAKISEVEIVIPMFGGSRGHRLGQSSTVGYEVLEPEFNAQLLATSTRKVLKQLEVECNGCVPTVRFVTVDIHSRDLPAGTFQEEGFEFLSANPAPEFAEETYQALEKRDLLSLPLNVIAGDEGARERTENFAVSLLTNQRNRLGRVSVIYMKKHRKEAGVVGGVDFLAASEFVKTGNLIQAIPMVIPNLLYPSRTKCVLVMSDDIFDTGSTNEADFAILGQVFPNARLKISTATHPVLSKGFGAMGRVNADLFLFGNSLTQEGLDEHQKVQIVDLAPSIVREIYR